MVVLFHIVPVLSLLSFSWSWLFFSPVFSVHLLRLVIAKHFVSTSDFAILAIPSSSFRLHVFALCQTARSSRSYIRLRRHVDKRFICRHERKEGYKHWKGWKQRAGNKRRKSDLESVKKRHDWRTDVERVMEEKIIPSSKDDISTVPL